MCSAMFIKAFLNDKIYKSLILDSLDLCTFNGAEMD